MIEHLDYLPERWSVVDGELVEAGWYRRNADTVLPADLQTRLRGVFDQRLSAGGNERFPNLKFLMGQESQQYGWTEEQVHDREYALERLAFSWLFDQDLGLDRDGECIVPYVSMETWLTNGIDEYQHVRLSPSWIVPRLDARTAELLADGSYKPHYAEPIRAALDIGVNPLQIHLIWIAYFQGNDTVALTDGLHRLQVFAEREEPLINVVIARTDDAYLS